MNLILHLTPETEAKLVEYAATTGKAPEELALRALEEQLAISAQPPSAISADEWVADIGAWAAGHRSRSGDANDSRESIYAGCGE